MVAIVMIMMMMEKRKRENDARPNRRGDAVTVYKLMRITELN